jgi:hypothetical protein
MPLGYLFASLFYPLILSVYPPPLSSVFPRFFPSENPQHLLFFLTHSPDLRQITAKHGGDVAPSWHPWLTKTRKQNHNSELCHPMRFIPSGTRTYPSILRKMTRRYGRRSRRTLMPCTCLARSPARKKLFLAVWFTRLYLSLRYQIANLCNKNCNVCGFFFFFSCPISINSFVVSG